MNGPRDPFEDLRQALDAPPDTAANAIARVEPLRARRTGVPEIVLADAKTDDTLAAIVGELLAASERVLVSRLQPERVARLAAALDSARIEQPFPGTTSVLSMRPSSAPQRGGYVAVFTAGTADLPAAGEAATVAREMGCRVELVADVGVAGLHRLVGPLRRVLAGGADVIVVAAGMDGALPSVVAGLVDVPVIGLPTSIGYGVATGGHAALHTMLSTCAPGMSVVNIDNGVGAGATAALIALRAGRAR